MSLVRFQTPKVIGSLLALLVVVGFPATSWVYWPAVGEAGVLPPETDTILIPMIESILLATVMAPVVGVISWLCLRRTAPPVKLLAWDGSRPILSGLVSICALPPLVVGVLSLWGEVSAPPGWHGLWWVPYTTLVMLWVAMMRSAALSKRNGS